jgi:hypothetical protein
LQLHYRTNDSVIRRQVNTMAQGETREAARLSPWNGILRGGLLSHIENELLLIDLYGETEAEALANAIRSDKEALAFVRKFFGFNGVRAVVALADTRRPDGSFDVESASRAVIHLALPVLDARAKRLKNEQPRKKDEKTLAEFQIWAEAQQRQQKVINTASVVGLNPTQIEALSKLRENLPLLGAQGPKAAKILDEVAKGIYTIADGDDEGSFRHALSRLRREDDVFRLEGLISLRKAQTRLRELLQRMPEVLSIIDVENLAFDLQDEVRKLNSAISERTVDIGLVEQVRGNLRILRGRFNEKAVSLGQIQDSAKRIDFVLRCLLWLNHVPGATAPTDDEARQLAALLRTTVESDLLGLFPGLSQDQINLLKTFGESILPRQLDARKMMQTAGHLPAGSVPTLAEGRAWFRSSERKNNTEIRNAYESFTNAWFYHRIVATIDDLSEPTVESLFEREASITGIRPLVCSGYALVGATLLQEAGARLVHFTLAVRATDEQIRNNKIDAGHAIAVMRRKGANLIVSNDSIVGNVNDAIGPEAVAWQNAQAPLHRANGQTLAIAKRALERILAGIANQ